MQSIVVLLHEGGASTGLYNECLAASGPVVAIASGLDPAVDVVVTGHTHKAYNCVIGGKIVTSAAHAGRIITDIDLAIDENTGDVVGKQAIEYVIRRAGSQMGVPYSWGGGSLTGPSLGIDSGADTVGFDCSGLTRYAFAGVGVLLPRFSGAQYDAGRKVPPSQAKRGDLLFWGSGGGQHEALYLGGGQMLEAQQTGVPVQISPVRTDGMTPYVTRIIES